MNAKQYIKLVVDTFAWQIQSQFSFVEKLCRFITAKRLIFMKCSRMLIISTDEDPRLRIESFAVIILCGVSTKLKKEVSDCFEIK